jgi:predicted transposase YbfD/YdcC
VAVYTTIAITTANLSADSAISLPAASVPLSGVSAECSAAFCCFVSAAGPVPADSVPARAPLDIAHHFACVPDPRHPAFRSRHLLSDMLVIATAAVLCGCKSWEAIADFGTAKQDWFRSLGLKLPNGVPAHDTFMRLFAALEPVPFQKAFSAWINAVCAPLGLRHVPIDGKAARGSRDVEGTCLHLVSAWAAEQRLSLAQVAVADKSNEITAIPELLELLHLKGALVSIDAIGCQKEIAKGIRAKEADYLLALKDNQPTLHADVQDCFDTALQNDFVGVKHDVFYTQEINHGRYEERIVTVIYEPAGLSTKAEWQDLNTVVRVVRIRRDGHKESVEVAHYLCSRKAKAEVIAQAVRGHWGIENGQHWCLDVLFAEDRCRTRLGQAAQNLAWLRKMALSIFNQDQSKGSIPTRQIRAAANDGYRLHLLNLLGEKSA